MTTSTITSFAQLNLDPKIQQGIEAAGYTTPTPVQAQSIPEILAGNDVVASAQTGTGKTASFVIPALQLLVEKPPQKTPRILILTPTRELATQITAAASKYGKFLKYHIVSLVGGMGYHQQVRALSKPVDIIIATPGRLLDHISSGRVNLSGVEMLVLDEADRMLDMGFVDDVKEIAKATSAARQTLLFSATIDSQLSRIIKQLLKEPVYIDLSKQALAPDRIKQIVYLADDNKHKVQLLEQILIQENIFKAIIFTATKRAADQLAEDLKDDGIAAAALHGDLKQAARNRTVEQLRKGKIQFIVATDVAARGIDIADLTHVINYDLPRFAEDYVHRIGRTGRAGKTGLAISIVLPSESSPLYQIEKYIDQKLEQKTIAGLEPKKPMPNGAKAGGRKMSRYGDDNNKRSGGGRSYAGRSSSRSAGKPSEHRGKRTSSFQDRSDRPISRTSRGERPARAERSDRGDFAPRRADRSDRAPRSGAGRSDRAPRADRGGYADRSERAPRSSDRGAPRSLERSGNSDRFGSRGPSRSGAPARDGRGAVSRPRFATEGRGAGRSTERYADDRYASPRDRDAEPRSEKKMPTIEKKRKRKY